MRIANWMAALAVCAAVTAALPSATLASNDTAPAQATLVDQPANAPVISDAEFAALETRSAATPELAEFRAGGEYEAIVAWSAMGVAITALVIALVALP